MNPNNKNGFVVGFALLVSLFLAGCSSRVGYEVPRPEVSTNALNINTATADELEKLPYIGRKTAESIVNFRKENGPFRRVEHLMHIRGVSERRFNEIRQFLKAE